MKQYKQNNVNIIECNPDEFRIALKSKRKKDLAEKTYTNANFFGNYNEGKVKFTLPVGHLVCDFESDLAPVKKYCAERGKFNGNKYCFDCGSFSYMNQFYGKAVSTFVIQNGVPKVLDLVHTDLSYDYAVTGVPVIRNGKDVKFKTYVVGQGWDGSTLYATKHIFVGLKSGSNKIYVMGWKSSTSNLIYSGEAYKKFSAMGFTELIKLDGGGSYMMKYNGKTIDSTAENRMDNAYIIIEEKKTVSNSPNINTNSYPKPERVLVRYNTGNDVKWVQSQLRKAGYDVAVDGSFGPASEKAYQDFCNKQLEKL